MSGAEHLITCLAMGKLYRLTPRVLAQHSRFIQVISQSQIKLIQYCFLQSSNVNIYFSIICVLQMIMSVKMLLSPVESMPIAQTQREVITARVCLVSNPAMVNKFLFLMMEPPAWVSYCCLPDSFTLSLFSYCFS